MTPVFYTRCCILPDVIRRPKTAQTPQRFKSFGSFGQFDTLIDGDSDDEVLEGKHDWEH